MKKILILMLVFSLGLMFVGCSDDDDDTSAAVTRVTFRNQTNADITVMIDDIDGTLTAGESWSYTFDSAIFDEDVDMLTVDYTVTGLYVATETGTATINKNQTTTISVLPEGGIIVLKNNHYININSALIYQADQSPSGNNELTSPLEPGDSLLVLKEANNYRVTYNLENNTFVTLDAFNLEDNQMSYASISAQKILNIDNQTSGSVTFRLDGGSLNSLTANTSEEYILGEEYGLNVEVSYNGLYIFAGSETYDFFADTNYDVEVTADGGAIFIVNGTQDNITEVYIAPSSDTEWGPDYMSGSIGPDQDYAWTVEPGLWDVKIVDDAGYSSEVYEISVSLNQSEYVDYTDKAKTRGTSSSMKNKAHYNFPTSGTRVEAN